MPEFGGSSFSKPRHALIACCSSGVSRWREAVTSLEAIARRS